MSKLECGYVLGEDKYICVKIIAPSGEMESRLPLQFKEPEKKFKQKWKEVIDELKSLVKQRNTSIRWSKMIFR